MAEEKNFVQILREGGVVVMPTDTIYGILGSALNPATVSRIYKIRGRNENKPCIILIASIESLFAFSIKLTKEQKNTISKYWPGKVSIIFDCEDNMFRYLHRGTNSIAFRLPDDEKLLAVLKQTGPLIAPSANMEGLKPAGNIVEAKEYFGEQVDAYVDAGGLTGAPSKLIKLNPDGSAKVIRE